MATQLFTNNATSTLAGAITAAATSVAVQAGHGARFPTPTGGDFFLLTLFQMASGIETNHEIVKVTARSVDTLTIVRAQENTTARAFGVGDQMSLRATAGSMSNLAQFASGGTFAAPIFAPTATPGTNTTQVATTAFATTAVANAVATLLGTAPGALDTLGELADALADDAAFSTTVTTALANRLRVDTAAQGLNSAQKANAATNLGLAAVATTGAKSDVGLSNVDNTSDANKPVSGAQQAALNLKADLTSPAFSGAPTVSTTAPQFSNDAKVANTAFVQRALGNMRSLVGIGANVTLNPSDAGAEFVINAAAVVTLPLAASTAAGAVFAFTAMADGCVIGRQGTNDAIIWNGSFNTTSVTLNGGDNLSLVSSGANWYVQGGTVSLPSSGAMRSAGFVTQAAGDNTTKLATTAFVQGSMAAYGIGGTSAAPQITNLDDAAIGSGMYYAGSAGTAGTFPGGAAVAGFVLHKIYGTSGTQLFQPNGADRLYFRRRIGSAWSGWSEVATLVSPGFSGTPSAPTAAPNTNTTQIATTAFVQRALGNMRTLTGIGSNVTLTASDAGAEFIINSTSTTTLPLANSVPAGSVFAFSAMADNCVIARQGTDGINWNGGFASNSVTLNGGDNLVLVSSGITWYVQGGTSSLPFSGAMRGAGFTTQAQSDNTTKLATTAFVQNVVSSKAALAGNAAQNFAANDMAMTSVNGDSLAGFRNVIINGDMRVAQRALPASAGYTLDRWLLSNSATAVSVSQAGPALNFPGEYGSNVLRVTGVAGNNSHNIIQRIEAASCRHMAGKVVTLSFWHLNNTAATQLVKCSLDYATGGLDNYSSFTNVGTSAGTNCPVGQWTFVTASFTVPTAAINGLQIVLGALYAPVVAGQSVSYGNVQLELGSVATAFERRPYQVELALCQRYYESGIVHAIGNGTASGNYFGDVASFKVTKRAPPTVVILPGYFSTNCVAPTISNIVVDGFISFSFTNAASNLAEYNGIFIAGAEI